MMFNINWKDPGHVLGVGGILANIIFGLAALVLSNEFRSFAAHYWVYWLFGILVLLSLSWAISLRHENSSLKGKLANPHFVRFEELTQIHYGHVLYEPFMEYEPHTHKPTGVGLQVLEELFGSNILIACPDGSTWSNMIDRLINGDFDVIATPLFETHERSSRIAFSTPIFFADIGVYVRKDLIHVMQYPLSYSQMRNQLRVLSRTISVEVIEGEISEKMVNKYLKIPPDRINILPSNEAHVSNLFRNLLNHHRAADVVFAERFFAESFEEVTAGNVVNILEKKELLYPVGFAMRKEDYILRNYINIKLMELDEKHPNRLMGFIINELKSHPGFGWISMNNALDYFVREKNV